MGSRVVTVIRLAASHRTHSDRSSFGFIGVRALSWCYVRNICLFCFVHTREGHHTSHTRAHITHKGTKSSRETRRAPPRHGKKRTTRKSRPGARPPPEIARCRAAQRAPIARKQSIHLRPNHRNTRPHAARTYANVRHPQHRPKPSAKPIRARPHAVRAPAGAGPAYPRWERHIYNKPARFALHSKRTVLLLVGDPLLEAAERAEATVRLHLVARLEPPAQERNRTSVSMRDASQGERQTRAGAVPRT